MQILLADAIKSKIVTKHNQISSLPTVPNRKKKKEKKKKNQRKGERYD